MTAVATLGRPFDTAFERVRPLASSAAVGAGFVSLLLNVFFMMRGVGMWDTGEFQTVGTVLGIAHPTGFPSYTLLAWLASVVFQPFGEPAVRANLLSAVLGATAVGLTAAIVAQLTHRPLLAWVAGLSLAISPVGWLMGVRADAHSLHFALAALILYLLVRWWIARVEGDVRSGRWLLAAAVAFAVSLGNHGLTVLLAPGIALFVLLVAPRLPLREPRLVLACAAAIALVTVALYAYLPLRSAMNPPLDYGNPDTWDRFRYVVFGQQFQGAITGLPDVGALLASLPALLFRHLGLLAPIVVVGLFAAAILAPELWVLTVSWFVLPYAFVSVYSVVEQIERYYSVPLIVATVWAAIGLEALWRLTASARHRLGGQRRGDRPPGLLAQVTPASAVVVVALVAVVLAPLPWRADEIRRASVAAGSSWWRALLPQLPQDAVVVAPWGYTTPLWYAQYALGDRQDLLVLDAQRRSELQFRTEADAVKHFVGSRPVFVAGSRPPSGLPANYLLRRLKAVPAIGSVWEVIPVASTAPDDPADGQGSSDNASP